MKILSFNFLLYTASGVWRPIEWTSKCSKSLYSIFTFFSIYLMMFLMLTHLLYVIFVVDNLESFVKWTFLFFPIFCTLFKMVTIVIRRDRIINLTEILQQEPCKACDEEEIDIQMKFERSIRSYTMHYATLCSFSTIFSVIGGIFLMLDGQIPYGYAWVPWDCTSFFSFGLTSLQEIAGVIIGIYINVATETTVLGFCLQTCAQFEILKNRLQRTIQGRHGKKEAESMWTNSLNNTFNKTSSLAEHVLHHLCIIRLAKMINDVFRQVIFVQFFVSILALCSGVYFLSTHVKLIDMTFIVYMGCEFVQIFFYCLGGNEVILKSTGFGEEIYHMDWILMTKSEQKDLPMIMKRSIRPVKFTSSFLVTLSLESYSNLLKTSFSAFNLVQQL